MFSFVEKGVDISGIVINGHDVLFHAYCRSVRHKYKTIDEQHLEIMEDSEVSVVCNNYINAGIFPPNNAIKKLLKSNSGFYNTLDSLSCNGIKNENIITIIKLNEFGICGKRVFGLKNTFRNIINKVKKIFK